MATSDSGGNHEESCPGWTPQEHKRAINERATRARGARFGIGGYRILPLDSYLPENFPR